MTICPLAASNGIKENSMVENVLCSTIFLFFPWKVCIMQPDTLGTHVKHQQDLNLF